MSLVAPQHVGSSRTRNQTGNPCIGRQILNHCATREVPVIFLINMASLLSKETWLWIMNAGNTMVGSYFEHQLSLTWEKLLKFLDFLLEKGEHQNTVSIWRNRHGNHLILWNVYISRGFLNNFMIINLELEHSVFNKCQLNNSTFASRKKVFKFCFDLIFWTLSPLECVQIAGDCSKGFVSQMLWDQPLTQRKSYYCSAKFDIGKIFGQFVLH